MMVKTVNLPMFGRRHTDSFKTIDPDRIQERFENHHQGRLKTEEVTNIVRAILKRYVDHAAKYLPDLRLKPGKTVTYGNLLGRDRREDTEAEALKTARAKHPDIFVPLTERVREKNEASKVAGEQAQRDVAAKPVPLPKPEPEPPQYDPWSSGPSR
jgi:adenylate kinase family enzyme